MIPGGENTGKKEDCPERIDDSYMEGEGEFYCKIHTGYPESTFSCNYNCEHGMCPRGCS